MAAIRTNKATHVLDDAKDARPRLLTKFDLLAHIGKCYFLWSRDNDGTEHVGLGEVLDHGNVLIGCPWWRINDQII